MSKSKEFQTPFDQEGNQWRHFPIDKVTHDYSGDPYVQKIVRKKWNGNSFVDSDDCVYWYYNKPFFTSMKCLGYWPQHSGLQWKDIKGQHYHMFPSDSVNLLRKKHIAGYQGYIIGYWQCTKKGQYYGVKFLGEEL